MAGIVEGSLSVDSNDNSVQSDSTYYSSNSNDDSSSMNEDSSDSNGEDLDEDELSSSDLDIFTYSDVYPYLFKPELSPSETPSGSFIDEESPSVICVGNIDW